MTDKPDTLPRIIANALPTSLAVAQAVLNSRQLLSAVAAELEACRSDPVRLARGFVAMRRLKDRIDELDSEFTALFETYKNEVLPGVLEDAGLTNVSLAEGFRVSVSTQVRASIREGKKEAAFAWLEANDLADIIQPTINSSTLAATARSLLEENRELPEDLFTTYTAFNTSVTATKGKN